MRGEKQVALLTGQERSNDAEVVLPFLFRSDAGATLLALSDVLVVVEMQNAVQFAALTRQWDTKGKWLLWS